MPEQPSFPQVSPQWNSTIPRLESEQFSKLPVPERQKIMGDTAREFMLALRQGGGEKFDDIGAMYSKLKGERLIVRRSNPEEVVSAVANNKSFPITYEHGTPYNNSVEWSSDMGTEGISNAYLEGYAHKNNIVAVYGFKPKGGEVEVVQLPHTEMRYGDMRREQVRSVSGTVSPENIRFVSLRIPAESYPEKEMTEDEQDRLFEHRQRIKGGTKTEPMFIHRGFLFEQKQ